MVFVRFGGLQCTNLGLLSRGYVPLVWWHFQVQSCIWTQWFIGGGFQHDGKTGNDVRRASVVRWSHNCWWSSSVANDASVVSASHQTRCTHPRYHDNDEMMKWRQEMWCCYWRRCSASDVLMNQQLNVLPLRTMNSLHRIHHWTTCGTILHCQPHLHAYRHAYSFYSFYFEWNQ